MKIMLIIYALLGLVIGGIFYVTNPKPPSPHLEASGKEIPVTEGFYCWKGVLSNQCVDYVYESAWQQGMTYKPVVVSENSEIQLKFRKKPLENTIKLELWTDEETADDVRIKNGSITAPAEKGTYVYLLWADWTQGNGMFAFSIQVK